MYIPDSRDKSAHAHFFIYDGPSTASVLRAEAGEFDNDIAKLIESPEETDTQGCDKTRGIAQYCQRRHASYQVFGSPV